MFSGRVGQDAERALRRWLAESGLKPGGRLPSERQLCRELGLTHYSVNRAMALLIAEGLVARKGYTLTYRPESTGEPRSLHLFDFVVQTESPMKRLQENVSRDLGVKIRVTPWDTVESFNVALRRLLKEQPTGLIVEPPFITHPLDPWEPSFAAVVEKGIPCVCIGRTRLDVPAILQDAGAALDRIFRRMTELGHTEFALVTYLNSPQFTHETAEEWRRHCLGRNLNSSVDRIYFASVVGGSAGAKEAAPEVAGLLKNRWKGVTALVVHGLFVITYLMEELEHARIDVPGDLSIVGLGEPSAGVVRNSISCLSYDLQLSVELAVQMLSRSLRNRGDTKNVPHDRLQVRIAPEWKDRSSIGPCPTAPAKSRAGKKAGSELPFLRLSGDPAEDREQLEAMIHRRYDLTLGLSEERFQSISLREHVNRPLNFRRGWFGDLPLGNFPPGKHLIHGIPFITSGGKHRSDAGAVVFRSANNRTGSAKPLPERISIPIQSPARAVYILHGCGFAKPLHHFATYRFLGPRGEVIGEVPLISLGYNFEPNSELKAGSEVNIQDWWPDFPQTNFPSARVVPVLGDGPGEESAPRYLYTLEWINPRPKEPVETLEIEVNPDQSATLGVLAVTVLKG